MTPTTLPAASPPSQPPARRGVAAVLAMLFLTLFATLAAAMLSLSSLNSQSASNLQSTEKARLLAEAGLRWQTYRFKNTLARPRIYEGVVNAAVATKYWPTIRAAIVADFQAVTVNSKALPATAAPLSTLDGGTYVQGPPVTIDGTASYFRVDVRPLPGDPTTLLVTSTGVEGKSVRKATMTFTISKKVKFAVVGKVPIQIGRNTLVEGNVAMAVPTKYPPILVLSDLYHFDPALKARVSAWYAFLQAKTNINGVQVKNHNGYDNRISVNNPIESQLATGAGFTDVNSDGFIDEYDLFVKQYDRNNDKVVSQSEFTNSSTGQSYDASLFAAIDALGGPRFAGDATRLGYNDKQIDNSDGYAKIRGTITLTTGEADWAAQLAATGQNINDMITGAVAPTNPTDTPITFSANASTDVLDLNPANFEQATTNYRAKTGSAAGATQKSTAVIANTTLSASDANAGTASERTPYGSTTWQATYSRPVFRNMTLRNVIIPKGLNALFDNCTFEGVTFVDTERNITKSDGKTVTTSSSDGMSWSQRMLVKGQSFSNNTALTASNNNGAANGNNLRFNDCTFKGPIAGNYATAYTHFANSWEFTGKTLFDNQVDETATIVSPQVNIEMGSFSDPSKAPSTLVGVVVAGNIDIRGYAAVDGSIIVTGDGAGNTTLGYFGPSDGDTNPSALPEGGYGKLNIRYNPSRALPDGINVPIDILPNPSTYTELTR